MVLGLGFVYTLYILILLFKRIMLGIQLCMQSLQHVKRKKCGKVEVYDSVSNIKIDYSTIFYRSKQEGISFIVCPIIHYKVP